MNKDFLNKKEPPSQQDILRYFFKREEVDEMLESLEYAMDGPPDLKKLGDPDEVQVATGTEWEISRAKWNTKKGPKYLLYLKRVGSPSNLDITNINLDYTMNTSNDSQFNNPSFNYNNEVEDIDYEDVVPMSFDEQLDYAIENEDFEEAARLRDWNQGLLDLMKELKPLFIEAIEKVDLDALDRYQTRINKYRARL